MELKDLVGKTLVVARGLEVGSERVSLFFSDLTRLDLYHRQSCCEYVRLEEVIGDVNDLIGRPLGLCEEVDTPSDRSDGSTSSTATWYKFVTNEGPVTLRWLGESNGYYSESVDVDIDSFRLNELDEEERADWNRILEIVK